LSRGCRRSSGGRENPVASRKCPPSPIRAAAGKLGNDLGNRDRDQRGSSASLRLAQQIAADGRSATIPSGPDPCGLIPGSRWLGGGVIGVVEVEPTPCDREVPDGLVEQANPIATGGCRWSHATGPTSIQ